MVLLGVSLTYAIYVKHKAKHLQSLTNSHDLHDNAIIKNCSSRLMLEYRKYITTTRTNGEMQYNLTQSTHIPVITSEMQNINTDILGLCTQMETVQNEIKNHQIVNYITISLQGRLGNVMFQLAALLSCAKRLNVTALIPSNMLVSSCFRILTTSNITVTNLKTFHEEMYAKYDSNIEHFNMSINWTLKGYFQSWIYFYKDEDLIRRLFKFSPNIQEPADKFVETFRLKNKTIVGVHVRRGDMLTDFNQKLGYATATPSYLHKSMTYFREKYSNIIFIIASDDISWCKDNIKINYDNVFSKFDDPLVDMAMLSVCDHVIITSGTFGWWGAWLAGGDVVYFEGYPRSGSEIDQGMCHEDYYPPEWIGME
ncbi:hypothetical protein ACJMK2_039051 [Sinanodonta woodiana]|uniref:L-Fucosyltransferase n=1 Tax=Sinanodonta woodiana TaxID=1069815 RepID=A0ABD3WE69_SINWO